MVEDIETTPQQQDMLILFFHTKYLNQARAGLWPACTWFLKIYPMRIVSMCVCLRGCPPPRLLITSGVMWHDMDSIQLVKQVL